MEKKKKAEGQKLRKEITKVKETQKKIDEKLSSENEVNAKKNSSCVDKINEKNQQ